MVTTTPDGQAVSYDQALAAAMAAAMAGNEKVVMIPRWRAAAPSRSAWARATGLPSRRGMSTTMGPRSVMTVPADEYIREFYDRWEDPNFQTWFTSRVVAAGLVSGTDGSYEKYLDAWEAAGKAVADGRFQGTPEQYLEWLASGQQVSAEDIQRAIESGEPILDANGNPVLPGYGTNAPANPITHYRSTSSATINREAAYAAVDQLSQALLGRMATKAEMRKARGVMNKMLASNPTVTTSTRDATDPNNVVETSHTNQGMSAADAEAALQMKIQRSSEGTAYTVGNMFEDAMRLLASKEG